MIIRADSVSFAIVKQLTLAAAIEHTIDTDKHAY